MSELRASNVVEYTKPDIFTPTSEEIAANAALIVLAVNNIEPLVEALQKIVSVLWLECQPDRGDLFSKIDDIARPVLAPFLPSGVEEEGGGEG